MLVCLVATGQTIEQLTKQIKDAEKSIAKSNLELSNNKGKQKESLSNIALVEGNISNRKAIITALDKQNSLIKASIRSNNSNITDLQATLTKLKNQYSELILIAYKQQKIDSYLLFIFNSKNFSDLYRRLYYIKKQMAMQEQKGKEIEAASKDIRSKNKNLEAKEKELKDNLAAKASELEHLSKEQRRYNDMLGRLKKEESTLAAQIKSNQSTISKLQKKIEAIVAEEARKQRDAKLSATEQRAISALTGSFSAARGKLPHPLKNSTLTERFGLHPHPQLPSLTSDNKGINIKSAGGANVSAVFEGIVTKIFIFPGLNTTVMIRHGDYITVYSNMQETECQVGTKVATNQTIGSVAANGMLHFEIWQGTKPQNPELWLLKFQ